MRHALVLSAVLSLGLLPGSAPKAQEARQTRNIILITLDGVRWQELFTGMDSVISADTLSGVYDLDRLGRDYWRPTPEARRRALMPFFWDSLVPRGILLGNRNRESLVAITNPHGFSAPGYQEILTGQYQPDVTSNDPVRYPHRTILEYLKQKLALQSSQVAVFGSWENFRYYAASHDDLIFVNAGNDSVPKPLTTPTLDLLGKVQTRALALWEGSRLDAFTGAMGIEYLKRHKPRVMYFAFNDTDDLAHSRRYDRLLDALHSTDDFLRELWNTVQSIDSYRNHTSIVITTDHGRGRTTKDWDDHGDGVPGSDEIWVAVVGPDTPGTGEASKTTIVHQADVAATVLGLLGLDAKDFNPAAGPVIPGTGAGR
ncbi:MAG TPA: sulfatase-like hydrolase/transferase [Gemmatimonadales bacterium]|nr:sulfatase-like hydrolase/transferase [Gemmatimonadales bacterium]